MGWDDQDLIFTAIATSGLSRASFAQYVVRTPVRTVERWVTGVLVIPTDIRNHLESLMVMSTDERQAYVESVIADAKEAERSGVESGTERGDERDGEPGEDP